MGLSSAETENCHSQILCKNKTLRKEIDENFQTQS